MGSGASGASVLTLVLCLRCNTGYQGLVCAVCTDGFANQFGFCNGMDSRLFVLISRACIVVVTELCCRIPLSPLQHAPRMSCRGCLWSVY